MKRTTSDAPPGRTIMTMLAVHELAKGEKRESEGKPLNTLYYRGRDNAGVDFQIEIDPRTMEVFFTSGYRPTLSMSIDSLINAFLLVHEE